MRRAELAALPATEDKLLHACDQRKPFTFGEAALLPHLFKSVSGRTRVRAKAEAGGVSSCTVE